MKVAFTFVDYDLDVSSGTEDSLHQWNELLGAFEVTEVAVINYTTRSNFSALSYPNVNIYDSLNSFLTSTNESVGYVEQGDGLNIYKVENWPEWLVFGAAADLPHSDINLPTQVALYARDAACWALAIHSIKDTKCQ